MCIRNSNGRFIKAQTTCSAPVLRVFEGEATGLLAAMQWVISLELGNVIFEVDSKMVLDSIKGNRANISGYGDIISSARLYFLPIKTS